MTQVERHAANAVKPLLDRHRLTPRSDAELGGIGLDDLEDIAPHEDKPRLAFLTADERAAIAFLDLEMDAKASMQPMLDYPATVPADQLSFGL